MYSNEHNQYGKGMWAQEIHRRLIFHQIKINLIYMYYLNTTCPPSCHRNGFTVLMAFHVRLNIRGIEETNEYLGNC